MFDPENAAMTNIRPYNSWLQRARNETLYKKRRARDKFKEWHIYVMDTSLSFTSPINYYNFSTMFALACQCTSLRFRVLSDASFTSALDLNGVIHTLILVKLKIVNHNKASPKQTQITTFSPTKFCTDKIRILRELGNDTDFVLMQNYIFAYKATFSDPESWRFLQYFFTSAFWSGQWAGDSFYCELTLLNLELLPLLFKISMR